MDTNKAENKGVDGAQAFCNAIRELAARSFPAVAGPNVTAEEVAEWQMSKLRDALAE